MTETFIVFGGHGKVALLFTKYAVEAGHKVFSVVRKTEQFKDIEALGGIPKLLSLEDTTVKEIVELFKQVDPSIVIFSAGAGGKGGPERTKHVDFEGCVKVCDAMIEAGLRRFLVVSACDNRDMDKPVPAHYTNEDIEASKWIHGVLDNYYRWKLAADKEIVRRTDKLDWTIARPSGLSDEEASGKIQLGHVTLRVTIARGNVAKTLLALALNPKTIHKTIDMTDGATPIDKAVEAYAESGETSYVYEI
ncbi:fungal protein [Schizosaccharomyces japonicus yFS275]|uniref:Fungal protein n=1 Tax=Schizosaccharomyces japonicus (strain yFS275 / FY16936) TaxID=402676 RepID=B6JVF6_SCHJY|nr:fungal protein [Schizosaccharomyces japonicus yFS275]EEB05357.1 fungal protein [Schizosaccharomyces japonicus yFS275]